MEVYEVNGLLSWSNVVVDQSVVNNGSSGTASTALLQPVSPNELLIVGLGVGTAAQTVTPGTGLSNDSGQQNPTTPASLYSFVSMSMNLGGAYGSASPSATFTSEPWAMIAVSLKPAAQGPANGVVQLAAPYGGYNYTNIVGAATTLIKSGPGSLYAIVINTPISSATVEMDDALTHTTPKIGTVTVPATITAYGPSTLVYDVAFNTGLSITTTGSSFDITVIWK
jgi:hypothetical protein